MKKTLTHQLVEAYQEDDYTYMLKLVDGYTSGKMRAIYAAIWEIEGHTAYCAAKRGEYTVTGIVL